MRGAPSATLTPETITDQLATNLVAPVLLAQAALRTWEAVGWK
ncbi:hypothetical protein GCM10023238_07560 [Streptomyces heliomycini]